MGRLQQANEPTRFRDRGYRDNLVSRYKMVVLKGYRLVALQILRGGRLLTAGCRELKPLKTKLLCRYQSTGGLLEKSPVLNPTPGHSKVLG